MRLQVLGSGFAFDAEVQEWQPMRWSSWQGGDSCAASQ